MRTSKGFTLIELLVVISIIGLLSSVVLASLATARARARDAKRIASIHEIQKALALYFLQNGQYPTSAATGGATPDPNTAWSNSNVAVGSWNNLQTALSPYLPTLPIDPKQDSIGWPGNIGNNPDKFSFVYYSDPTGSDGCALRQYILVFKLENLRIASPGVMRCANGMYNQSQNGSVTVGEGM